MSDKNIKKIVIYTTPTCSSCKKVKNWFVKKGLAFRECNILYNDLKREEIITLLNYSNNGFQDIISERSKSFDNKLKNLKTNELIELLTKNPLLLKRPIIVQEEKKRIQVGYNEEQIELFLRKD